MKLLYLLPRFPVASETFVAEEILGMERLMRETTLVALVRPRDGPAQSFGSREPPIVR